MTKFNYLNRGVDRLAKVGTGNAKRRLVERFMMCTSGVTRSAVSRVNSHPPRVIFHPHDYLHKWSEPYPPLLPSRRASPVFGTGRYTCFESCRHHFPFALFNCYSFQQNCCKAVQSTVFVQRRASLFRIFSQFCFGGTSRKTMNNLIEFQTTSSSSSS